MFALNKLIIIFFFLVKISITQELTILKSLDDIRSIKEENAGKVLVFNFWATWCKPCVEEFPELIKIHQKFKSKDFKLIFISLDFKEDINTKLLPFLKNNNVDFKTYYLDVNNTDDIMNYFNVKWDGGIPATFIFDTSEKLQKFILGENNHDFFEKEIKKFL